MGAQHRRKVAAVGVVLLLVGLAGCLSMAVETTVASDGTIEETTAEIEMDGMLFDMLEEEGDFEEDVREDVHEDAWGWFEYDEEELDNGDVLVTITAQDGDPDKIDDIDVTVDEEADQITFVDYDGFEAVEDDEMDEEFLDEITFEYTVNMPGEVVEANGEIQDDGQSVVWTNDEHAGTETFEVTSERSSSDGFGNGFGPVVGILALALLAGGALVARR